METHNKKSIISEIKSELDDLENHLKKGSEEFKELYKEKKQKLANLIKTYASEIEESGEDKIHDLKDSSKELLDLLEADYDLSYTDYENESHKISKAIDTFELKAKEIFNSMRSDVRQAQLKLKEELSQSLDKFKVELDIQKAHLKGTKDRASTEFDEWKEKRLKDIEGLKTNLEQKKEETEDKLEKFNEEISSSFDHLKKAFKKLW